MTFAPDGDAGSIRWAARSHAQIYADAHTQAEGAAHPLVPTVSWWRQSAADLAELRSLYEAAVDRLMAGSAGANAEAAAAAARLVTRGLAEAQELTILAGAQRQRLSELNNWLRDSMPEPKPPAEHSSEFLLEGCGWLLAPDFDRADGERLNAEEVARDLMRDYEQAIAPETLADEARHSHRQLTPVSLGQPTDDPTLPMLSTWPDAAPDQLTKDPTIPLQPTWSAPPAEVPDQFAGEVAQPPSGDADPLAETRHPGESGTAGQPAGAGYRLPVPRVPEYPQYPNDPQYYPGYPDFGPEGHAYLDVEPDPNDDEPTISFGTPPAPREYEPPAAGGRATNNPFAPDVRAYPPVLGGD